MPPGRLLSRRENRGPHICAAHSICPNISCTCPNIKLQPKYLGAMLINADRQTVGGREENRGRRGMWRLKSCCMGKGWMAKKGLKGKKGKCRRWKEGKRTESDFHYSVPIWDSQIPNIILCIWGNHFLTKPKHYECWNFQLGCIGFKAQSELGDEGEGWGGGRVSYVKLDQGVTGCGDFLCKCGCPPPLG